MSKTVTFQQRIQQLRELEADLPEILGRAAEEATKRAVQAAAAATPPKEGSGRGSAYSGTHTLTGELKAHWATDSRTRPVTGGREFRTRLATTWSMPAMSTMDTEWTGILCPGLYVNPDSGLLEYDPAADVGIVVGTKTKYVKGEYMADKGIEEYQKAVREILDKAIEEAMKSEFYHHNHRPVAGRASGPGAAGCEPFTKTPTSRTAGCRRPFFSRGTATWNAGPVSGGCGVSVWI